MLAHTYSKGKKMIITKEDILNEVYVLFKVALKHISRKKKAIITKESNLCRRTDWVWGRKKKKKMKAEQIEFGEEKKRRNWMQLMM